MSSFIEFLSASSMFVGSAIILRQMLIIAYEIGGWTGPGVLLILVAVMLFALHVWLTDTISKWKAVY